MLGLAAFAYILGSVIVAAVRWFHMCRPYDQHPEYYYPGRRFFASFSLSTVVLIPYVVNPDSIDALYLVKTFLFPVFFYYLTHLMYSYFGNVMQWRKWRKPMWYLAFPVYLTLTVALVFAIWPGDQIDEGGLVSCHIANHVLFFLGVFLSLFGVNSLLLVWKWSRSIDEDEFSNPTDFPVRFAFRMMMLHMFVSLLLWANVLIGTPVSMAVVMVLLTISEVFFLISALHPQRTGAIAEAKAEEASESAAESTPRQSYLQGLTKEREAEILYAIQAVVIEQQAYLDPHLTLQDIAQRCGYSRTYISGLFKSELGGFFSYINLLRLEHAEAYQRNHPEAGIQEVATESGFSSRQNYYSVKARLTSKTEM